MDDIRTRLRSSAEAFRNNTVYDSEGDPLRLIVQADECDEAAGRIDDLEALLAITQSEVARLSNPTWFYADGYEECCMWSPDEVIDYVDLTASCVVEILCARPLPSIWAAVIVTDNPDADERYTYTEHETKAAAEVALEADND